MIGKFKNTDGKVLVEDLIEVIHQNSKYLSDLDGKIGDGDHGINMDKGFQIVKGRLDDVNSMSDAMKILSKTLLLEIGGSMGPLYGMFFKAMAKASTVAVDINPEVFCIMLEAANKAVQDLGGARPGDKTLIDTLDPAVTVFRTAIEESNDFHTSLDIMVSKAKEGWQSTEDMVAKIGRSSRLGERSRGVLDAGATSCFLILNSMSDTIKKLISRDLS